MKKLSLATLSTLTLASTNVFALDGTITVNGVVTDGTCTLKVYPSVGSAVSGFKDITVRLIPVPKSRFTPNQLVWNEHFYLHLENATATGPCDAATTQAFKGIHLSAISPDHLDTADKTLLVNKATGAGGASSINPVFLRMSSSNGIVDFSAPWGTQLRSDVYRDTINNFTYLLYSVGMFSKTGIVDAQNVHAIVNYTMHYN
ncbi:fimbrial protein [Acinetobacter guillouiae]|uniref:fimbrial protein n=1 Tax=Acinetobacter guillouiae TaxID=106649 RepID=UPI003AF570CB